LVEIGGDEESGEVEGLVVAGGVGVKGIVEEEPAKRLEVGRLEIGWSGMGWPAEMIEQFTHDIDELKDGLRATSEVEEDGAGCFVIEGFESEAQFVGFGVTAVEGLILILYIDMVVTICSRRQGGTRGIVGNHKGDA